MEVIRDGIYSPKLAEVTPGGSVDGEAPGWVPGSLSNYWIIIITVLFLEVSGTVPGSP